MTLLRMRARSQTHDRKFGVLLLSDFEEVSQGLSKNIPTQHRKFRLTPPAEIIPEFHLGNLQKRGGRGQRGLEAKQNHRIAVATSLQGSFCVWIGVESPWTVLQRWLRNGLFLASCFPVQGLCASPAAGVVWLPKSSSKVGFGGSLETYFRVTFGLLFLGGFRALWLTRAVTTCRMNLCDMIIQDGCLFFSGECLELVHVSLWSLHIFISSLAWIGAQHPRGRAYAKGLISWAIALFCAILFSNNMSQKISFGSLNRAHAKGVMEPHAS